VLREIAESGRVMLARGSLVARRMDWRPRIMAKMVGRHSKHFDWRLWLPEHWRSFIRHVVDFADASSRSASGCESFTIDHGVVDLAYRDLERKRLRI